MHALRTVFINEPMKNSVVDYIFQNNSSYRTAWWCTFEATLAKTKSLTSWLSPARKRKRAFLKKQLMTCRPRLKPWAKKLSFYTASFELWYWRRRNAWSVEVRLSFNSARENTMWVRIINITSPSEMQRDMLETYLQNVMLPAVLEKGAISARFIRVEDTKACLMTFWPDQETAVAAKDAQRAMRDEIRKNHKIVSTEGMTSFVLER